MRTALIVFGIGVLVASFAPAAFAGVPCSPTVSCPAIYPVCMGGFCQGCKMSSQCGAFPTQPICNSTTCGACVACSSDSQCGVLSASAPICITAGPGAGGCTKCTSSAQCLASYPSTPVCSGGSCVVAREAGVDMGPREAPSPRDVGLPDRQREAPSPRDVGLPDRQREAPSPRDAGLPDRQREAPLPRDAGLPREAPSPREALCDCDHGDGHPKGCSCTIGDHGAGTPSGAFFLLALAGLGLVALRARRRS